VTNYWGKWGGLSFTPEENSNYEIHTATYTMSAIIIIFPVSADMCMAVGHCDD